MRRIVHRLRPLVSAARHISQSLYHPYVFVTEQGLGFSSGLGNKLFVLATAVAYELTHGQELVVEATKSWGASLAGGDHEGGKLFRGQSLPSSLQELFPRLHFESGAFIHPRVFGVIEDQGLDYSMGEHMPMPFRRNVELRGYFLNTAYFHDKRSQVLERLRFADAVHDYVEQRYGARLREAPTIGVHVRRGDRAADNLVRLRSYYSEAFRHFGPGCQYIVISDDIPFCRDLLFPQILPFDRCLFVEGERHFVDLLLFSKCAGQVIADSTFSWWGCYLSDHFGSDQIVCPSSCWLAPRTWRKVVC